MRFIGVAREPLYSPGKVAADREILEAVAARLRARHRVGVIDPEGMSGVDPHGSLVFAMCQGPEALACLRRWQEDGCRVINTPDAIEACHRHRMVPALGAAGVKHPRTEIVNTSGPVPPWFRDGWIKRGDVHATEADDVVRVTDARSAARALNAMGVRGIVHAALQEHVAGEVVKFYAVRGSFFHAVHEGTAPRNSGAVADMRRTAEHGARALGLEVYGGDLVIATDGLPWIIDLNDWPSYGRCRSAAADAIADYLENQATAPPSPTHRGAGASTLDRRVP